MTIDNTLYHIPVMVDQVCEYIGTGPLFIDATLGGGGHSRALLEKFPNSTVIGIDWDRNAMDRAGERLTQEFPGRFTAIWGNFAHIERLLRAQKIKQAHGILADFGTSQFQIHESPGFSFMHDTPLDMRMSAAHQHVTAATIVNNAPEQELTTIFSSYGEERHARIIARKICAEREKTPIVTTRQLSQLVIRAIGPARERDSIHPATRVFQALRIAVNHELDNIKGFLAGAGRLLAPNGNLVCISFHSLEDRIVKEYMRENSSMLELLTPKGVTPTEQEIAGNPASRSARLRAARKMCTV